MITITSAAALQAFVSEQKASHYTVGLTPTMGALHNGHFSLIRKSKLENDISICSVFVNPTQFNEASDLDKYPRTLEKDAKGLQAHGCDVLFAPSVSEVYPQGKDYKVEVNLNGLDRLMEGAHRPGHFEGVVQVVKRLIEMADCNRLYMGQKDFQQFTIIRQMIADLDMDCRLVVCAILRAEDGLAMSSRNVRLLPEHRKKASLLFRVLTQAKEWLEEGRSPIEITTKAMEYLEIPDFKPEYFDIIDGYSLQRINEHLNHDVIVACTAVWAGDVRLIDNMILKGEL